MGLIRIVLAKFDVESMEEMQANLNEMVKC